MAVPSRNGPRYDRKIISGDVALTAEIAAGMFKWWNETARSEGGFTAEGFTKFFTDDAVLIVNGDQRAKGPDALARHFEKIRVSLDSVSIRLPLEHAFGAGDDVFLHYRVDAVAAGVAASEEAMGYLRLRDGHIAVMNVLSRDLA
jgi:ketosteroid isomerase-like protein